MIDLFQPFTLGETTIQNRFVMAPMTRGRADSGGIPNAAMAEYYSLRASAGLIVTEATAVSPTGHGWVGAPGIFTDDHQTGWERVVSKVHDRGGRIALQLWHMGRVSHPDFLGGDLPVGPSALAARGETHTPHGKRQYVVPRALGANELPGIEEDYAQAARRAVQAGFDFVEVHAANGYLLDQFMRDSANQRTDEYGGTVENRIRFPLMVIAAVCEAVGPRNVGVRVSPRNAYNDMSDSDPTELFTRLTEKLSAMEIAFLHVVEPGPGHMMYSEGEPVHPVLREKFAGTFILNGGLDLVSGQNAVESGSTDLVSIGVPFIANPDLIRRLKDNLPLAQPDYSTLYSPGEKGYLDYGLVTS